MDDSYVDDALASAEDSFRGMTGGAVESGLDIDDGALVQLRKGCRLLKPHGRSVSAMGTTRS